MSRALRRALGHGLVLLGACDPFPRVNPVDPGAVGYVPALDAGVSRDGSARDGSATDGPVTTRDGSGDVNLTGPAELVWVSDAITDATGASLRNNGNGRAEPGETLRVNVTLRNAGGSAARGVTASLVASGDCATAQTTTRGALSYGSIEPGATAANNAGFGEQFEVTLSPTCVPGSSVELTLQVRDAAGASWNLPFQLPIVTSDAAVVYVSNMITDATVASLRNNGNGRAEPGETLRVNVTLRNAGSSAARGVTTTLVATGDCATAQTTTRGALSYGSIEPGATAANNAGFGEQFEITLSPTACAPGTPVTLTAQARDASGTTWNLPFQLPIVASDAAISYVSNTITDATGASLRNNGNGRAEPGETLRVNVTLRNAGRSTARGVTATLIASSACATAQTTTRGALSYGSIEPDATATNNAGFGEQFEVTLSPTACVPGTPESLTVQVRDASGTSWNLPFQLPIVASDAAISYVSNVVTDPSSISGRNNGNGRAEPGETLRMNVTLRNAGGSTARGVSATLLATGACATVQTTTRGALDFGSIAPGATAANNAGFGEQFVVTLSPTACVSGSSLDLTVQARDASGTSWPLPFALRIE